MAGILIKNGRVWDGNSFGNWDILTDENENDSSDAFPQFI